VIICGTIGEEPEMQVISRKKTSDGCYYALPATVIPAEVLYRDKNLCRVASRDGRCFAQVEYLVGRNIYRARIAADPCHPSDDQRSHLIDIPAATLPLSIQFSYISAAAIPELLLSEDGILRQIAHRDGVCPALIERQIHWDLYRIRLAADSQSLSDDERSHTIYLSQSEMQAMGLLPEWETCEQVATTPATQPDLPERQEPVVLMPLDPVEISEEDLRVAASTVNLTVAVLSGKAGRPGSKSWRQLRSFIELVLYRAALRAASHKKALQETIRRVLVARKLFTNRLISIRDMFIKDGHTYWSI